jgi:hypothetical protein
MAASKDELEQLIRAADAAGDADAVRVLFDEMDKLGSTSTPPTAPTMPRGKGYMDAEAIRRGGFNPVTGFGEAALQAGTGFATSAGAGLAGLGGLITNPAANMDNTANMITGVQERRTYQPRTPSGQEVANAMASPKNPMNWPGTLGEFLGDKSAEAGLPPWLSTSFRMVPEVGTALIGGKVKAVGERPSVPKPVLEPIPTTEQLSAASKSAYKSAKDSGVIVPPEGYGEALGRVQSMLKDEGLNPTLHPKSTAVLKELEGSSGKALTLQEAETLRKIARDAEDDLNPVTRQPTPDSRLAGKIVDELDESIDALSTNNEARALWSRSRRSQMIDQMIHRAEIKAGAHYTHAGMEHALRQEFKQLALNPRRRRGLTAEQRAAIEKVAKGGPVENTLRALGKFDPTSSVVAAAGSAATGALFAPVTGGASLALPVAGFAAKRGATALTARNVDAAREALVGRGLPKQTSVPSATRTPTEVFSELRKLDAEVAALPKSEPFDSPRRVALQKQADLLRAELTIAVSNAASRR